jgi:hypothetical protein
VLPGSGACRLAAPSIPYLIRQFRHYARANLGKFLSIIRDHRVIGANLAEFISEVEALGQSYLFGYQPCLHTACTFLGFKRPASLVTGPLFSAEFHAWKAAGRSRVRKALSLTFLVLG